MQLTYKHPESDQETGKGHSVSIGTGKIAILWGVALAWVIGAALATHNLHIALYGITLLIVAIVSCIHVGWLIDRDHIAHDRVRQASVQLDTVQPAIDTTTALMAGWVARGAIDDSMRKADRANDSQPGLNVFDIHTHHPVPPQRNDAGRAMRSSN